MSKNFVHVICDYGNGDPAFGEVMQRLHGDNTDLDVTLYPTSVEFADTVGGGFWIYQYLMGARKGQKLYVYSNIAPRKEQTKAMVNNAGEGLKYGKLKNGTEIVAVNANHVFSFVKPHLAEFRDIDVSNQDTQFRSRDNFIQIMDEVLHGDYSHIGKEINTNLIPDAPDHHIGWIDGYGNIKTTIRKSTVKFKPGSKVRISLNNIIWTATVVDGSFSVNHGELAFAPGSSGHDDPFMEIFLRRAYCRDVSAADVFNKPVIGSEIKIVEEEA